MVPKIQIILCGTWIKHKQSYKKNIQRTKVVQNTDINEIANLFSSTRRLQTSRTMSEQVKQP